LVYVWEWYVALANARGDSGGGPQPLGWRDLDAWSNLTGARPSPFELQCLMELDVAWLDSMADNGKKG